MMSTDKSKSVPGYESYGAWEYATMFVVAILGEESREPKEIASFWHPRDAVAFLAFISEDADFNREWPGIVVGGVLAVDVRRWNPWAGIGPSRGNA